jgi:5-(aminomethyl)-3-furanmethanol phosphate kinase
MMSLASPLVVKVGGSLYDLPDLRTRLSAWLATQLAEVILVPGGGVMVEAIRQLDQIHHLGEEACHWLAVRTLTINAHFLAQLLPEARIISDPKQRELGALSIMDMFPFALADETCAGRLPHGWEVTSDSLALRVAILTKARKLVLLKSVDPPAGNDWQTLEAGVVDSHFREVLFRAPFNLPVEIVNLRDWPRNRSAEETPLLPSGG